MRKKKEKRKSLECIRNRVELGEINKIFFSISILHTQNDKIKYKALVEKTCIYAS